MKVESVLNIFIVTSFILLLMTVDSSLTTSIALDRDLAYTPWLFRIGPLSIADWFIVVATAYVILKVIITFRIPKTPYIDILLWVGLYLILGLSYNIFVYPFWKPYIYDLKAVLYLTIPYLFLYYNRYNKKIMEILRPRNIILFHCCGGINDLIYTNTLGFSQYAEYLGLPSIPEFLPGCVIVGGLFFSTSKKEFLFFGLLLMIEIISSINRYSLGAIYYGVGVSALFCLVLYPYIERFLLSIILTTMFVSLKIIIPIMLIYNPVGLVKGKSDGAKTRVIQFENSLANTSQNIPGFFGKGLGVTWFEYISIPRTDLYSVGTSVGKTAEESIKSKVKFIFNFGPANYLHKWGFLGFFVLMILTLKYFCTWRGRIIQIYKLSFITHKEYKRMYGLIVISTLLILDHVFYIGVIRRAFLLSMIAFWTERRIISRHQAFIEIHTVGKTGDIDLEINGQPST